MKFQRSPKLNGIRRVIDIGDATYQQANEFAIEVGEILASVFQENLSSDILPNGRMYYNIAKKVVEPMMVNNHFVIADNTKVIQTSHLSQFGYSTVDMNPCLSISYTQDAKIFMILQGVTYS